MDIVNETVIEVPNERGELERLAIVEEGIDLRQVLLMHFLLPVLILFRFSVTIIHPWNGT
jgi:hypothetical protein